jgi:ADP-ribose pyrophosphatase YjhB (NUDIX family)
VEPGETCREAIRRELAEETGESMIVGSPVHVSEEIFVSGDGPHHEINVVFHVERDGQRRDRLDEVKSRESGVSFEWAPQARVVELDLRPPSTKAWIASGMTGEACMVGWFEPRLSGRPA